MGNTISNIIDWFIPLDLKSDRQSSRYRKSRLLIKSTPILMALILAGLHQNYRLLGEVSTPHLFGVFAIAAIPFILKFTKNYLFTAAIIPVSGILLVPFAAYFEGGITSQPTSWFVLIPIAAVFFLGARVGILFAAVTLIEVLFLALQHYYGQNLPLKYDYSEAWVYYTVGIFSLLIYNSFLAWQYERAQSMAEENYQKSKEKAQNAVRAKDVFWGSISHEIRTPMNGIVGMTTLLLGTEISEDQREYLEIIKDSTEGLQIIINDVLDYSKLETGELSLKKAPFNLNKTLNDVLETFTHMAIQKNLKLSLDIDSDVPMGILCDELRLRQILVNLVGNALKFTQHGRINLHVSTGIRKNELRFRVKDSGIGIPYDKRDKIFTPFSQVDDASSRAYGGSGIGLTICKKLVETLGGKIGFESQVGIGSEFFFTIFAMPVKLKSIVGIDEYVGKKSSPYIQKFSHLNILVVEDNPVNQKLILSLLARQEIQADKAGNGLEAIERVKEKNYDLIFMDIQMPLMDGITATKEILALDLHKTPAIVAISANVLKEDQDRCFQAGMDDFLPKPINPNHLNNVLRRYSLTVVDPKEMGHSINQLEIDNETEKSASEETFKEIEFAQEYKNEHEIENEDKTLVDEILFLEHFSHDTEVIQTLIDQFQFTLDERLETIESSIEKNDFDALEKSAHSLKGTVANFFCKSLHTKVLMLEKKGKEEVSEGIKELWNEIQDEIKELNSELTRIYQKLLKESA